MNKTEKPRTLRAMLENSAENYAEKDAFLLKNDSGEIYGVKYKNFKSDVDALAAVLLGELDLRGKKIAVCGKNSYEWCLTYMAVVSGVGILVPIDKELTGEEIANLINMGKVDCFVGDKKSVNKLLSSKEYMASMPCLICSEESDIEQVFSLHEIINTGYELLKGGYSLPQESQIMPDALAVLLFTSGTTGFAKGVMLSNNNLCSDLAAVCEIVIITCDDVSLSVLPLHHTYESIAFLMVIFKGGCISFSKGFKHIINEFSLYKPTVLVSVPLIMEKMHGRIISAMEKEGKLKKARLFSVVSSAVSEEKRRKIFSEIHSFFGGRLRKIIVGAAAIQKNVVEDFELFGFKVVIGYGLTECSPIVICNSEKERTSDSIGKPITDVEVKIVDADEQGIGEIHVKGPMVMLGYHNNKEETERVMKDGWFNTGDLGYKDKNGNYHITGRSKNIIVTNTGKNIYPEELELQLMKSPLVAECLVYSRNDNVITAEILPDMLEIKRKSKKDEPDDNEIYSLLNDVIKTANKKLAVYKRINSLVVRDSEFSKTTTHKIKRG